MKKLIILITGLIYCSTCMGQQTIESNSVSVKLPNEMKKLSKVEVSSFANRRFANDTVAINTANSNLENTFVINDVLVSFNTATGKVEPGHLLKLKNGLAEMSKKDRSYTSSIKTFNNNQVLVTNYVWGNIGYYCFYSFDEANSSALAGFVEYNKSDQDKATTILNNFLSNLKFIKQVK